MTKDVFNDCKLLVYGCFKQAKEGDVMEDQPWAYQSEKRKTWEAWNAAKGMSKEDAITECTEEVEKQKVDLAERGGAVIVLHVDTAMDSQS